MSAPAGALFLMGALCAEPAHAQTFSEFATGMTDSLQYAIDLLPQDVTNVGLGLGPSISPHYQGDDEYNISVIPAISLRYRDLIEVNNNEVRVIALNRLFNEDAGKVAGGNLRIGPTVSIDFGRKEKKSSDLTGMGNVGTGLELGAFVAYTEGRMRLRARAKHDVAGGHGGGLLRLDVGYTFIQAEPVALGINFASNWATGKYMRSFFGVTSTQSAASGLPVFTPGSGFKDVGMEISANYIFSRKWVVVATAGYKRLLGDAADSPLVRLRGSSNQLTFQSFLVYSF